MKINYFVSLQIKHHKVIYMLSVLLYTVVFVLCFSLFAQFNAYFKTSNTYKNVNDNHILYVSSTFSRYKSNKEELNKWIGKLEEARKKILAENPNLSFDSVTEMAIQEIGRQPDDRVSREELNNTPGLEDIWYCGTIDIESKNGLVFSISSKFADRLNYKIKKGRWLSESNSIDNVIDVVIFKNNRYSVGDIFPLYIWQQVGEDDIELTPVDLSARVIGICDYEDDLLSLNVGSNDFISISFNHLSLATDNIVLCNYEDILPYLQKYNLFDIPASSSLVVKLHDNLSDNEILQSCDYLIKNRLSSISFSNIYKNTVNEEKMSFGNRIILFITAVLYSVISITSLSVFQLYRSKKQYRIYYTCGMPQSKYKQIHMLYELRSIIFAIVLSVLISLILTVVEYIKKYAAYIEYGYNEANIKAWISLKNFVYITPVSLVVIIGLSFVITLISTIVCSTIYNIENK